MADKKMKPRGLGRGLSALMADVNPEPVSTETKAPRNAETLVPIEKVRANPEQPRRQFLQEDLDDLTASIKEKGVLQPLIVRPRDGGMYEIVAGERRWRAAQAAKLHEVPVLIRDYSDVEMMEVAIIENIQRSDLNAMEEAQSYKQLMEKFGHTQEKMAEALGKSRSHIANLVRLLHLPEDVQELVQERKLSDYLHLGRRNTPKRRWPKLLEKAAATSPTLCGCCTCRRTFKNWFRSASCQPATPGR
ncbi:ParB/RepB/Spo0J family partition protein [Roseobacteraceae bacterium NS-SX3]